MRTFNIFLLLFVSIFTILSLTNIAFAVQTNASSNSKINLVYEKVNPKDDYQYSLKRFMEKITLFVLSYSPSRKANYQLRLLDVRLAELKYVVDHKDIANIQNSSQRYSTLAGQLKDFILNKKLDKQKDKVKTTFTNHLPLLEELMNFYPDTTAEWRFVKQDFDYIKIYLSQLG